jgi:hypothetical protein
MQDYEVLDTPMVLELIGFLHAHRTLVKVVACGGYIKEARQLLRHQIYEMQRAYLQNRLKLVE